MIKKIDCLGDICPIPVLKVKEVLDKIYEGEKYVVITDHSCSIVNLENFCIENNLKYESNEVINGVWEITISSFE